MNRDIFYSLIFHRKLLVTKQELYFKSRTSINQISIRDIVKFRQSTNTYAVGFCNRSQSISRSDGIALRRTRH